MTTKVAIITTMTGVIRHNPTTEECLTKLEKEIITHHLGEVAVVTVVEEEDRPHSWMVHIDHQILFLKRIF